MQNPKQSKTLHVEMLGEELSVYDWKRQQMHSLNPTAAKVFALCDGETSPEQMAAKLDAPQELIWQSLAELDKAKLLEVEEKKAFWQEDISRRQFLKVGAGVAAAAIVSMMLPNPAAAQSAGCTVDQFTVSEMNRGRYITDPVGTDVGLISYNVFVSFTITGMGTLGGAQSGSGTFTTDASGTVTSALDFGYFSGFVAGDRYEIHYSGTTNACNIIDVVADSPASGAASPQGLSFPFGG